MGSLDEIYHLTKTGSKNLTKNLFIRHARTDFNQEKKYDGLGVSQLIDEGFTQAQNIVQQLETLKNEKSDCVFVLSPLPRCWDTIKPTLKVRFSADEVTKMQTQFQEQYEKYQKAYTDGSLFEMMQ